jgi:hypothetical protein
MSIKKAFKMMIYLPMKPKAGMAAVAAIVNSLEARI